MRKREDGKGTLFIRVRSDVHSYYPILHTPRLGGLDLMDRSESNTIGWWLMGVYVLVGSSRHGGLTPVVSNRPGLIGYC